MKNILLRLEYDGTNYCGWQRQNDKVTIQGTLEKVLESITKEKISVVGCSRTDSGVHAKEYICNFMTNSTIPSDKFMFVLNQKLPEDIVVLQSEEVEEEFHSRYSSKGKTYIYKICNRESRTAIGRNLMYHYRYNLNLKAMEEACKYFLGTHDFEAFRNLGSSVKTTVRTIHQLIIEKDEDTLTISVSGDGFLYNMVRIIVGTLIEVGIGKKDATYIAYIIESKNRQLAGPSVPAHGLYLKEVLY